VNAVSERSAPLEAQLDAWRKRGAHRLDPARFRAIEALALRAGRHSGEARRLLDARLSELMAEYAALAPRPDEAPPLTANTARPPRAARSANWSTTSRINHAPPAMRTPATRTGPPFHPN
jgi:hypothetical protein